MTKNGSSSDLTQLTLEELQVRKDKLKGIIIGLGLVMGVALAIILYLVLKNGSYALLVVGITAFITLMPGVVTLNKVNEEIKSRTAG
jgi:VIT1/CCC1 family predicted Fe2+/Mn2+ transporter